jgi:CRISPR-associated protein Csb3
MRYSLQANPFNPVEYLACCGLFEILVRFDARAMAWWAKPNEACFNIESEISEESFLQCLKETFSDYGAWSNSLATTDSDTEIDKPAQLDDETEDEAASGEGADGSILTPTFQLNDQKRTFSIDWWYETLKPDRTIREKSGWKMYAGNQTVEGIVSKMTKLISAEFSSNQVANLTALLRFSAGMTGRFGFDPRSTRNALEAGFSPNDLGEKVKTYPVAELLAGIGANYFFPPRTQPGGGTTSARGWVEDKIFQYALWQSPLPLTLARVAASGRGFDQKTLIFMQADRVSRDKYSNFKMARTTTSRLD